VEPAAKSVLRWRAPPNWLWPVSVALQVVGAALLTSYTYFFFDDFLFLRQAQTQQFGVTYLRESLFEHFSPVTRILDKVLVDLAPGDFFLAHSIQLVLYAAAIVAFALVMRTILGNNWTALALTVLFGQSIFLMRLLNWWTATANILPATVFMLIAIAGYLRWRTGGSQLWLFTSFVAFAISLLDYETAMLFPVYLALISLLVLEERLGPRSWLATLWKERWAWIGYGLLEILAVLNYVSYYYSPMAHPTLRELGHYMEIALFESFVPALVGIKDPQAPLSGHTVVIVVAGLLVGSIVVAILYLRPRAWRCLVAFILVFLVTMAPVGLNRIRLFGVSIAQESYYEQSLQFMCLILLAFALSPKWGGQRVRTSGHFHTWMTSLRLPRRAIAIVGATAIAGYGVLYVTSVGAMAHASWEPRTAHAYVDTFLASVARVKKATGHQPVLIDHEVPVNIMAAAYVPYNRYDQFFGLVDPGLRVDQLAGTGYFVSSNGSLVPVHFISLANGLLESATVSNTDGTGAAPALSLSNSSACVPSGSLSRLHVRLSRKQMMTPQATGLPYAIRVHYRMPSRIAVSVLLGNPQGIAVDNGVEHIWGPGEGGELAPLSLATQVDEVDFDLPAGACLTGLTFGVFSPAGPLV
jgi:hypothetical protein